MSRLLTLLYLLLLVIGVMAAHLHAQRVQSGPGNRFYITDVNAVGEGKNAYLLHDTAYPAYCMLVLESSTSFGHAVVWSPRSCK